MLKKIFFTAPENFYGGNCTDFLKKKGLCITKHIVYADVVVNSRAFIEVPESLKDPRKYFEENVVATFELLELLRKTNRRIHLIQPSSNIPYGNPIYNPIDEDHPQNPISPYAATRVCQETLAMSYYRSYGIPVTVLRFSNLFGPNGKGVINKFIDNGFEGKPLVVRGGKQVRTFTFIEDASRMTELCISNPEKSIGQIFNACSSSHKSVSGIAFYIANKFNVPIIRQEYDTGDIRDAQHISNKKARNILGYAPEFSIFHGIEKTIDFERRRRGIE